MRTLFLRIVNRRHHQMVLVVVLAFVALALALAIVTPLFAQQAQCWKGSYYGWTWQNGELHNFVHFYTSRNVRYNHWAVSKAFWWLPSADLWAFPDSNGNARAGLWGEINPTYPASSGYRICGWN